MLLIVSSLQRADRPVLYTMRCAPACSFRFSQVLCLPVFGHWCYALPLPVCCPPSPVRAVQYSNQEDRSLRDTGREPPTRIIGVRSSQSLFVFRRCIDLPPLITFAPSGVCSCICVLVRLSSLGRCTWWCCGWTSVCPGLVPFVSTCKAVLVFCTTSAPSLRALWASGWCPGGGFKVL